MTSEHTVRQHDTHRELLGRPDRSCSAQTARPPRAALDAIIVPAARTGGNLDQAFRLAREMNCWLAAICSHDLTAGQVRKMATARSFESLVAVDLPPGYSHELLSFSTTGWLERELPDACTYTSNLSVKRNVGLLLSRLLGWRRIFFLDDDIRQLSGSDLRVPLSMLADRYTAVGLRVISFPDNSIACHAHRDTGGAQQDVFVSGSSLLVDTRRATGFFPALYNEDWLYFYAEASAGRLATADCGATQIAYDPYADPQRAAWQEFGDLLAEGLYGLLHGHARPGHATARYWTKFQEARAQFLRDIRSLAERRAAPASLIESVVAAEKVLAQITPEMCARYIELWQRDLKRWRRRVRRLRRADSVSAALDQLGLTWHRPEREVLAKASPAPIPTGASGGRRQPVVLRLADPQSAVGAVLVCADEFNATSAVRCPTDAVPLAGEDSQPSSRLKSVLPGWLPGRIVRSAIAGSADVIDNGADQAIKTAELAGRK